MKFIVIFGGVSFEHEISIVSAITLKKELANIEHFIFIDAENDIFLIPKDSMKSTHFSTFAYKKDTKLNFTKGGFLAQGFLKKQILQGVVINLIHGKSGEDGQIPSLLEFYKIPYIGPRIEASAISFSKELTKIYAKSLGVPVLDYRVLFKNAESTHINFPCIVKPSHLGSSIGIAVAKDSNDLSYCLDCAFEFDESVIIEEFIPHIREFNLAGCKIKDEFIFSIIEEVKKNELFAFEDKYLDFQGSVGKKEADLSDELKLAIKAEFIKIYEHCFEGALIRCDFFMLEREGKSEIYLNEINPIPGSLAYYLFDDFSSIVQNLAHNLPRSRTIPIKYQYISRIQAQKGK